MMMTAAVVMIVMKDEEIMCSLEVACVHLKKCYRWVIEKNYTRRNHGKQSRMPPYNDAASTTYVFEEARWRELQRNKKMRA
ncbi:hypothetical protein Q3G72_000684 [Acer saccharum]|nr:hypothetical protein Q3G72_000684 [Acer saccharum]